jgi:ATP-dependent helicase/nuclease subunit A
VIAPKWTNEQLQAIRTQGRNLLVSAAAGSGKTAVLANRCAYLVCDAESTCDIDQLLVVTFTNAAAEEMRKRIGKAIAERAAASADPRLQRQALLINAAQISTIHSLGSAIIRRHFDAVGLDPNFRLLDEDEAKLLRADIATEIPELRLSDAEADLFRELIDQYGGGNPASISDLVLTLHARLASLIDPDRWLAERRLRVAEAAEKPLADSELGRQLIQLTTSRLETLERTALRLADAYDRRPTICKYGAYLREIAVTVSDWRAILTSKSFDQAAAALRDAKFDRLPTVPKCDEKEVAQAQINKLRKRIDRVLQDGMLAFDEAQLRDGMQKTLWVIDQIAGLLKDFETRYAAAKRQLGALDFNDLERMTLRLLRDPETGGPTRIATEYQQQFCHVLVDEYQDINEVQDTIISLLSRADNLFVVGDVKQSIYRFRQADVGRFIARYKRYKRDPASLGQVIDLQQNFRSRAPLLQVLNGIFGALMTRQSAEVEYSATQRLVPGATFPPADGTFAGRPIELHVLEQRPAGNHQYEADEREAVLAAMRVRHILGMDGAPATTVVDRDGVPRPAEPRDVVILLRAMRIKAERFADILRRAGIAVKADSTTGFFAATEIGDLLCTLRLIDNGRDDVSLAAYLRSPIAAVPDAVSAMAEARLAYPSSQETPCLFHSIERFSAEHTTPAAGALKAAIGKLEHWRQVAQTKSVADLINVILQETSLLAYVSGLPDGPQRVANITHFHDRALQFEAFNRPTVARFLHFLTGLEDESDIGMPAVAGAAANAVRIMSIHKSKGLEFPIVILPDLGKGHNLRDAETKLLVDDNVGIAARVVDPDKEVHYASLGAVLAQEQVRRKSLAEELRVLYVAATRAKEHLILIGTAAAGSIEQWDAEWSSHRGAIDAGDVLGGGCMLDWIGPASAIVEASAPGSFDRREYTAADIEAAAEKLLGARARSAAAGAVAQLRPLSSPPPADEDVAAAIERVEFVYPFAAMAAVPAVASVTSQSKRGKTVVVSDPGTRAIERRFDNVLHLPRCLGDSSQARVEDVGSATHALLQRLDFTRCDSIADLRRQVQSLTERRFLRPQMVEAIDYAAITWLLETELGQKLRTAKASDLMREVDVVYAASHVEGSGDPRDRVMVRGRVDAILIEDEGLQVIDYKTDRVSVDTVDARAEFYAAQIDAYAEALARITHRPVRASTLVFLTPRLLRTRNGTHDQMPQPLA